jgi:[ribosomal protein S5]-alanine N-acetyltransferase
MNHLPYVWGDHLPTLTGRQVALRELDRSDVPALFAMFSDPRVMRYWSRPPFENESEAAVLLDRIEDGFRSRQLFQWGITRERELLGTCTLFHLDLTHRHAEIGYALAHRFWGQGWARDAVTTAIDFAFDVLDLHRIEADVDPRNTRSLALLERLGFRREGCLRERYIVSDEIQDALLLGLLRSERITGDAT